MKWCSLDNFIHTFYASTQKDAFFEAWKKTTWKVA